MSVDPADEASAASGGPAFDLFRRAVPPDLRPWVTDCVHYRERFSGVFRQVETASLTIPLVIGFSSSFAIALGRQPTADETYASFTSGLFAGPVFIRSTGGAECVQINFTPLGARRFFGIPMSELSGAMVHADALADGDLDEMRSRLGELPTPERRLDLALETVRKRLRLAPEPDRATRFVYDALAARSGNLRIERLAREVGWSRKHLASRLRDAVGMSAKPLARIMRFGHAQAMAQAGDDWAEIAAACGYADQSHLTREFVALAGAPPSRWRAEGGYQNVKTSGFSSG